MTKEEIQDGLIAAYKRGVADGVRLLGDSLAKHLPSLVDGIAKEVSQSRKQ